MFYAPTWAAWKKSRRCEIVRILLTNDDGIHADGLAVLERIAAHLSDDVWIVAPETDQSGLAHSLTLSEPLRLRKIDDRRFALKGTPTDCVIMGVRKVMPEMPDLILSGVNSGANIGDDVTYSGTVAGAMEGTLLGIRSIALSQAYNWEEGRVIPWDTVETLAPDLLKNLMSVDLARGVFLNINFPNCSAKDVAGSQVTDQGKFLHGLGIEERFDGRGFPYYWLRFGQRSPDQQNGTDVSALRDRKVSITPLTLDLTAREMRERISKVLR